jgi:hypothetical protein
LYAKALPLILEPRFEGLIDLWEILS